jgi:hypothetical protein
MPAAILERRTHRARSVRTVTVQAVVGDEEFSASADRSLVALVWVFYHQWLYGRWKSDGKIIVVLDETQAVPRNEQMANRRLVRRSRDRVGRVVTSAGAAIARREQDKRREGSD